MELDVDGVKIDVPLLIGLEVMDKHNIYVGNVENLLVCKDPMWSCQAVRE